jgi:putative ABC transport system permease protein
MSQGKTEQNMRWTRFIRRRYWHDERARELEAYLEIETDENIARGMSPAEARYAAHRKLGNTTLIREEIYRMNSLGWLETLWQDLRFALRMFAKSPGATAAAVISLAIAIGPNCALFSVMDRLVMKPPPVQGITQIFFCGPARTRATGKASHIPISWIIRRKRARSDRLSPTKG